MPSMRWFPIVPIEKACHTRKLYAGSSKPVAPSLTPLSSVPSSPSRKQKCPPYSPLLAPPSLQPCSAHRRLGEDLEFPHSRENDRSRIHLIHAPGSASRASSTAALTATLG